MCWDQLSQSWIILTLRCARHRGVEHFRLGEHPLLCLKSPSVWQTAKFDCALSCTPRIFCLNPWFTWLHGESYTAEFDSRVSCMHKDVWNCVSCKLLSLTSRCHHAHHGVTPVGMMILRSLLRSFVFSTPHRRVWNRDVPHAQCTCTLHSAHCRERIVELRARISRKYRNCIRKYFNLFFKGQMRISNEKISILIHYLQ